MKTLLLIFACLTAYVRAEFCYSSATQTCSASGIADGLENCDAKFSAAGSVMQDLSRYLLLHVDHSFQHLLMSINFANHEKNRAGFVKLYREISDKTWEDAIDLVKYITKRGGEVEFKVSRHTEPNVSFNKTFEMYELESLSRSLDMHKFLAEKAHNIHSEVTKRKTNYHDAETISYIEEKFVHKHADKVRELAGYTNDLSKLLKSSLHESPLAVFLFDEYLQKAL